MPDVPNNPILEFATSSAGRQRELSLDKEQESLDDDKEPTSLENLTIFGTKPNAIVRPLQRETPAPDGLSDGIAKRIKQIEDDKVFLEKLTQKRQFNRPYRDLLPKEPVKTVRKRGKDAMKRIVFKVRLLVFCLCPLDYQQG